MKTTLHLKTLEVAFIDAFRHTIEDYKLDRIEIEEDCRASFYHHLRPTIDEHLNLQIYLSHNLQFVEKIVKPDITIVRANKYFLCSEIKIATKVNGKLREINVNTAKGDIKKIKSFQEGFSCGYAVRIENRENKVVANRKKYEDWMPDYFRELYYLIETGEFCFYAVRNVQKKVGRKTVNEVKGGLIKVKMSELGEQKLSQLIKSKFKTKYGEDLFV